MAGCFTVGFTIERNKNRDWHALCEELCEGEAFQEQEEMTSREAMKPRRILFLWAIALAITLTAAKLEAFVPKAFGEPIQLSEQGVENPFRFSTKYFDPESESSYYGYRYYSPSQGRWLGRDPIAEFGGLNLYGFVRNRPINFIDTDGRIVLYLDGGIILGTEENDFVGPTGPPPSHPVWIDIYGMHDGPGPADYSFADGLQDAIVKAIQKRYEGYKRTPGLLEEMFPAWSFPAVLFGPRVVEGVVVGMANTWCEASYLDEIGDKAGAAAYRGIVLAEVLGIAHMVGEYTVARFMLVTAEATVGAEATYLARTTVNVEGTYIHYHPGKKRENGARSHVGRISVYKNMILRLKRLFQFFWEDTLCGNDKIKWVREPEKPFVPFFVR